MTGNPMTGNSMTGNQMAGNQMAGNQMAGNQMTGSKIPNTGTGPPLPDPSNQMGAAGNPTGGLISSGSAQSQTIQKTPFFQCTPGRPATGTVAAFCGTLNGTAVQTDLFTVSQIGTYVLMWDKPVGGGCKWSYTFLFIPFEFVGAEFVQLGWIPLGRKLMAL